MNYIAVLHREIRDMAVGAVAMLPSIAIGLIVIHRHPPSEPPALRRRWIGKGDRE